MKYQKFLMSLAIVTLIFTQSFGQVSATNIAQQQDPNTTSTTFDHYAFLPLVMVDVTQSPAGNSTSTPTPDYSTSRRRTPTSIPTKWATATKLASATRQPTATSTLPPTATATRQPTATQIPSATPTAISTPTGHVLYVSTTGNDANPGTQTLPFKSIQHAVDLTSNPGDKVLVFPGEYRSTASSGSDGIIVENKNGLAGQEIVIQAYDLLNKPVIVNRTVGFRVTHSTYVIIDGFEVKDFYNAGFSLNLSSNIIIRNNYVHLGFQGMCQPGEGLPMCKADGTGVGTPKGRLDNLGKYILEDDGFQNIGIYLCKSQKNTLSSNRIEETDEGIYVGKANSIINYACSTNYPAQLWSFGNVVENNILQETHNEGIELKPDAIRTIVRNNVLKNAAGVELSGIEVRSAYNDISENVVFGDNAFSKTGIRLMNETGTNGCYNAPNDELGNSMQKYNMTGGYTCSFENKVHNNYIYYTQGNNYLPAINNHDSSAANVIDHNTIVGGNDFGIISDALSSTLSNNLILGSRALKVALLTQIAATKPASSNFNAYYPDRKSNGGCNVNITGSSIFCDNGKNSTYEVNSVFMYSDASGSFLPAYSPIKVDGTCSQASLGALSLTSLQSAIKTCSQPLNNSYGSQIVNKASDGTNIGAAQP